MKGGRGSFEHSATAHSHLQRLVFRVFLIYQPIRKFYFKLASYSVTILSEWAPTNEFRRRSTSRLGYTWIWWQNITRVSWL